MRARQNYLIENVNVENEISPFAWKNSIVRRRATRQDGKKRKSIGQIGLMDFFGMAEREEERGEE